MDITGSLYRGNEWNAIALYNFFDDVYRKPYALNGLKHFAHVKYVFDSIHRSLDVYLVKNPNSQRLKIKRIVDASDFDNSVDLRNSVKYELISSLKDTRMEEELISTIRKDIRNFCQNPAKIQETATSYTRKIIPITAAKYISREKLLEDGKKEFVPACILRANLDFSSGCIAGFVPEKNSSFDGNIFKNFYLDISSECEYCYAIYHHKTFPKSLIKIDKEQLKEELTHWNDGKHKSKRKVDVLRLGKRTEARSVYTRDSLIATLEACLETGTQIVMPTKYLEFDNQVAELFKKTNSVVLSSIGYDEVETGPILSGMDNDFRMEQAVKYREAGVNSVLYLLHNALDDPWPREISVMKFAKENNVPMQSIPMKVFSKDLARKMFGKTWSSLKSARNQLNMLDDTIEGGYNVTGNGMLSAEHINDFWKKKIESDDGLNNGFFRMCHHNSENTYCGGCFIRKGFVTTTTKVKIDYTKKRKAETYNKKIDKNQMNLFKREG